jgi:hypothetical protein
MPMTRSGLSDGGAAPSGGAPELAEGLLEVVSSGSATSADGVDVEARHRLRRTLRILLAARRRDDGGFRDNGS